MTSSHSKLTLDRYATGELPAPVAASIEEDLDERAQAHLEAVEKAKAEVRPLDLAALRARAAELPEVEPDDAYGMFAPEERASAVAESPPPEPANNHLWARAWGPLAGVLAAALALFLLLPSSDPYVGVKGGEQLDVYLAGEDGRLYLHDLAVPVGEGDVLGFEVGARDRESVVVVSVDGTGAVSLFFPEQGPDALPLDAEGGPVRLDGTVTLDNAPGPEVFLAVFDRDVYGALDDVRETFEATGHDGLVDWADTTAGVVAAPLVRR